MLQLSCEPISVEASGNEIYFTVSRVFVVFIKAINRATSEGILVRVTFGGEVQTLKHVYCVNLPSLAMNSY